MRDRLLTNTEKAAIKTMRCGKCKKHPPYLDGSWTQKHRLVPGSKGGRYTVKNTVPRCPGCHAKEPGHAPGFIMLPFAKQREGGRKGGRRMHELHPDHARWLGRTHGRKGGRKGALALAAIQRAKGWAQQRKAFRRACELHPDHQQKANRSANHIRWHVKRCRKNPKCSLCASN